jgi:hypothetical protein
MARPHAIPAGLEPRPVLLRTTLAVALERVRTDPERVLSRHPDILKATDELLSAMPLSEWTFDTSDTDTATIVDQLVASILS